MFAALLFNAGCTTAKLPSEDIEVPVKYRDIIAILKSDKFPSDSKEKYEAARELISKVDLYYTRELKTVNELFNYKDMLVEYQKLSYNRCFLQQQVCKQLLRKLQVRLK